MVQSVVAFVDNRHHNGDHLPLHPTERAPAVHQPAIEIVMVTHGLWADPMNAQDVVPIGKPFDVLVLDKSHSRSLDQTSANQPVPAQVQLAGQDAVELGPRRLDVLGFEVAC